jgi:hypothetical protein
VGTGLETKLGPVLLLVKLANQFKEVVRRGVDIAAEFGDLLTQFLAVG